MNYYDEIKYELINNEINRKAKNCSINKSDLNTYYKVGKILFEAGKHYGEKVIKEYSAKLTIDIGKGYGTSNLKRMRQFYCMIEKGVALPHQLSWSHILMILPLKDVNKINYYINTTIINNYSYRELGNKIKNNEYKIKIGDSYNYIDLLLYNFKYKCFVVIELKITELKSEHTGQIQKYMNYIDKNVKDIEDNRTVGIIIYK